MKTLFIILIFALSAFSQDLPTPKEVYSKDSKRLVELSKMRGKINNGKRNFPGKISKIQWHTAGSSAYFDIGKETFNLDFSNVSNVSRSHLKDLLKRNNKVFVRAYAGGSNGIWLVIDIYQR